MSSPEIGSNNFSHNAILTTNIAHIHVCPQPPIPSTMVDKVIWKQIGCLLTTGVRDVSGAQVARKDWLFPSEFKDDIKPFFEKACAIWKSADHSNLAPHRGDYACSKCGRVAEGMPLMFREWYTNGSVRDFVNKTNPGLLDRLKLIRDIAAGIAYLHGCNPPILHGRLNPTNVMITADGKPVITDYGLHEFYRALVPALQARAKNPKEGGSSEVPMLWKVEWTAPEIAEKASFIIADATEAGDVFSFGCIAYEILTGFRPVWRQNKDAGAETNRNLLGGRLRLARLKAMTEGHPPAWERKDGEILTDAPTQVREWIEARWSKDPEERGNMHTLLQELDQIIKDFEMQGAQQ